MFYDVTCGAVCQHWALSKHQSTKLNHNTVQQNISPPRLETKFMAPNRAKKTPISVNKLTTFERSTGGMYCMYCQLKYGCVCVCVYASPLRSKRCSWAWQDCSARPWCCHRPAFHLTCPFSRESVCRMSPCLLPAHLLLTLFHFKCLTFLSPVPLCLMLHSPLLRYQYHHQVWFTDRSICRFYANCSESMLPVSFP